MGMTQEDKELLLKDLCARLPYKVRCRAENGVGGGETDNGVLKFIGNCSGVISGTYEDLPYDSGFINNVFYPIESIKPYLRPMSSMTEEEKKEYWAFFTTDGHGFPTDDVDKHKIDEYLDWLNAHHFDFRGLIPKGLAIAVTEENNPYKK